MRYPSPRQFAAAFGCTLLIGTAGCERGIHVLYGFINDEGGWVAEPTFDDLAPLAESLAAAKKDGLWGFVDSRGSWIIEPRYAEVKSFREGLAAARIDAGWQFIRRDGQTAIPGPFDEAEPFEGGMAAVRTDGGWGFVDHAGQFVIAAQFEELGTESGSGAEPAGPSCFSEGLCAAKVATGWGFVDRAGRWVVPPEYPEVGWFREGLAAVREAAPEGAGQVGFIDRTGKRVIEPRFESSLWFSGGRAIAVMSVGGAADTGDQDPGQSAAANGPAGEGASQRQAVMIDTTGRQVAVVGWQPLMDGSISSVAAVLSWVAPDYLSEGLVPATRDGAWGFMDRDGKWVIEPRFGLVMPFHNGVAAAAPALGEEANPIAEGGWGLIDTGGRWVVEPSLRNLGRYGEARVMAQQHTRWGLLDRDGQWRVLPRFADEPEFLDLSIPGLEPGLAEGLQRAAVFADHRWIVLDRRGRTRELGTFEWLDGINREGHGSMRVAFLEHGLWGIADRRFERVLAPQLDEHPRESEGLIQGVRDGRVGCLDGRGRWVVPAHFREIAACARGATVAATDTGWGVWMADAGWRLPPEQSSVVELWPGVYAAEAAEGWRLFRLDTKVAAAVEIPGGPYEALDMLIGGVIVAMRDARFAVISAANLSPDRFPFDEIGPRYVGSRKGEGQWIAAFRVGERWGVVDASGRETVPARYDEIGRGYGGLLAVRVAGRWGIVDLGGSEVFPARFEGVDPISRDVAAFRREGLWGLVSRSGAVLLEPQFSATNVQDNWLVVTAARKPPAGVVEEPALKGIVDRRGRVVVQPAYELIEDFGDRYWLARKGNDWLLLAKPSGRHARDLPGVQKIVSRSEGRAVTQFSGDGGGGPVFGYLDDRGRVAIPPAFSEAQPFRDGTAVVHRNQKCGVIDRNGRERLPIEFDHCNRLPDGRVVAAVEAPFDPEKWAGALELERESGD